MPSVLCEHCTAVCCRYIALPIEKPETPRDFDDVRWYLMHEGISVFVEDGQWYMLIQSRCQHLRPDHRCGIYETRPRICRSYTTDNCDYHSGDYGWEAHFATPEHLDAYMREHGIRRLWAARDGTPKHRGPRRPRLRARLRPAPAGQGGADGWDPSADATDTRGTPLPVLPAPAAGGVQR